MIRDDDTLWKSKLWPGLLLGVLCWSMSSTALCGQEADVFEGMKKFTVSGHQAFLIPSPHAEEKAPKAWVWYAPTLMHQKLPGTAEVWMFDRFLKAGIGIAGIDVGESFGNPMGRGLYQRFYQEMVGQHGFHSKPVLLARSRGGLMLYNWAVEHPESVGGVAGIYPVCNLKSYPGVTRAAKAYGMTVEALESHLVDHNPVDRLKHLAVAKVPLFHIHGDRDTVVPIELNSRLLADRYVLHGGPMELEVIPGQGHNMWPGWFQSEKLVEFVISHCHESSRNPD